MAQKLPLAHALGWIVASLFLITGLTTHTCLYYRGKDRQMRRDPSNHLTAIVQTGPQKEALKTVYLAELVGLSIDKGSAYFDFNTEKAEAKLLKSPLIKQAKVTLLPPSTLAIDYTIRQPIALLYDIENSAIDEEGRIFPVSPYLSPKNLPQVYLGLSRVPADWHTPIRGKKIELALQLLKMVSTLPFQVARIDVSKIDAPSLGTREIVLVADQRFLRLSTKNYLQELGNYLTLREKLQGQEVKIIDFRIPNLAFLKEQQH
jgi:hypothetical protein